MLVRPPLVATLCAIIGAVLGTVVALIRILVSLESIPILQQLFWLVSVSSLRLGVVGDDGKKDDGKKDSLVMMAAGA